MKNRAAYFTSMQECRRALHRRAECSWQEYRTRDYLLGSLEALELELEIRDVPGQPGFLAIWDSGRPGRKTVYRADMDALPMQEETGLDFASEQAGVMHACGHDFHMAALLGLAAYLADRQAEFCGQVGFLFQSAEETADGARQLLETGLLQSFGAEAYYGGHVWDLALGQVVCRQGPLMAAADIFRWRVRGQGGHGAAPEQTRDPITGAASILLALQTLVARRHSPFEPVALSICHFAGGHNHNVVPDEVLLEGTLRSYSEELRQQLLVEIRQLAEQQSLSLGLSLDWGHRPGPQAVINDAQLARRAQELLRQEGLDLRTEADFLPSMLSEDFSAYGQLAPSLFFFFGASAAPGQEGGRCALHQSDNCPDERVLGTMLQTYSSLLQQDHGC